MISVLLPLFRAKYIGWLPLEGLKNQKSIDFEWEIIIAEEQKDETFGEEEIRQYESSLSAIGCIRIKYIPLEKWIPLSKKIIILVNNINKKSQIITHASGDDYLPPLRLHTVYKAFKKNIDWFRGNKLIMYDLTTKETILHNVSHPKGTYRAFKSKYAPKSGNKVRNVDRWYYDSCTKNCKSLTGHGLKIFNDTSDDWKYGFGTHGFHNLSLERIIKPGFGFGGQIENPINLHETIPEYVMKRLDSVSQYISHHKYGKIVNKKLKLT